MNKIKFKDLRLAPIYLWSLQCLLAVGLILLLLLSYLLYINYTFAQTERLTKLKQEEHELKNSLSHKYRLLKSVAVYQQKMTLLNDLENQIKDRFPPAEELPSVLLQINQLAEDSNVMLNSFLPKEIRPLRLGAAAAKNAKIMAETFAINGIASYSNFIAFIYQIAGVARVFEITNLQLTRIDNSKINLNFDLVIFYSSLQ